MLFSVSGKKLTDITGNGASSDDTGLGGITIFIDKDGNSSLSAGDLSTVTASDGSWSFTGLDFNVAGKKILEVVPGGYIETVGTPSYTINGTSGTNQTGLNFENFKLFSVSGQKLTFNDTATTEIYALSLHGALPIFDKDGNSSLSAGDLSTVTASDGSWSFTGLDFNVAGKKILEVIPGGYIETVGTAGYAITGTSGTHQTGLDRKNVELGKA